MSLKNTILTWCKGVSITALLAGAAFVFLPAAGCTRQNAQIRASNESTDAADVTLASDAERPDEQTQIGERKRTVVTRYGPRPR